KDGQVGRPVAEGDTVERIEIANEVRPIAGAVAHPQLPAIRGVLGREENMIARHDKVLSIGATAVVSRRDVLSLVDVLQKGRSPSGPVADPELVAVNAVIDREDDVVSKCSEMIDGR